MNDDLPSFARNLATELADLDPGLPATVEALLQRPSGEVPGRFDAATLLGIASLVLGVAQFAYQIRRDRTKDRQVAPEVLKRRLRIELEEAGYPDTGQRAKVIDAAVRIIERSGG